VKEPSLCVANFFFFFFFVVVFGVCVLLRLGVFEDAGRALEGGDGAPFAEVVHVWCFIER
jgi:hypothetical protein